MYTELSFDEDEFLRIYKQECIVAQNSGAGFFRHNLSFDDDKLTRRFVSDIRSVVHFIYDSAYHALSLYDSRDDSLTLESSSAHTEIMTPIYYGLRGVLRNHCFSNKENIILEAIRINDLPKNRLHAHADLLDEPREYNEIKFAFFEEYRKNVPFFLENTYDLAVDLLKQAEDPKTIDTRIFRLTDVSASIFLHLTMHHNYQTNLSEDFRQRHMTYSEPKIYRDYSGEVKLTSVEREALKLMFGTRKPTGPVSSFELLTCDFLSIRNFNLMDDFGYFTALIIAFTLATQGRWYSWREKQYISTP